MGHGLVIDTAPVLVNNFIGSAYIFNLDVVVCRNDITVIGLGQYLMLRLLLVLLGGQTLVIEIDGARFLDGLSALLADSHLA